jgi:DNA modification methylase
MAELNVMDQCQGGNFAVYNADCVEFTRTLPDNSVGVSVYSPPFAQLFVYSDIDRDMGNVKDEAEFIEQYRYLVRELYRATKPGRLTYVHCSDIPRSKAKDGYIGLYDFPADIRRVHEEEGWTYVYKITIWKDPVVEMTRTKAHGLLYKTIKTDSTRNRVGMPDYIIVMRKTPDDEKHADKVAQDPRDFPVDKWQQWASPVWMDINQTNVLNVRVVKEDKDEKHLCPLQLDVIERCIVLGSNSGDVVFSPFLGIGSEGWVALKLKRRFIGTELKPAYYRQAVKNLMQAEEDGSMLELDLVR